jgi:H+-transporting ATPase
MTAKGLSSKKAQINLKLFGSNVIEEKKKSWLAKSIKWFLSPISLMLLAASLLSLMSKELFDFYFILFLLFFNFIITFFQEKKADDAIEKLKEKLDFSVEVLRDGKWIFVNSSLIVPDDIIKLANGDIVPADIEILEANNLLVNQAALTGESIPQEKKVKDTVYSGSFVFSGTAVALVKKTGSKTYMGNAVLFVEDGIDASLVEKDILTISKFLSIVSLLGVLTITIFLYLKGFNFLEIFTLDLSLIIAGIPVAISTVITIITSLGVFHLTKKNVAVRRLSSLEDLANVNLLLTDKTGTLTKNEIAVQEIIKYNCKKDKLLFFAFLASKEDTRSLINKSILDEYKKIKKDDTSYKMIDFIPANSDRKRSTAIVQIGNETYTISVGAPQVIENLCELSEKEKKQFEDDILKTANDGFRVIAISVSSGKLEKDMTLCGLFVLSDPLRRGSKKVIDFMKENGIRVKMLTGDNKLIGERIAKEVGLSENDVFSEVLPKDKLDIVLKYKKRNIVAVTGDGINDLPAVKSAHVGIAVSNAVSALKSSADIVLLGDGIAVIKDAVIEARKIFSRLYSYSVYRISESFRIILTIVILVLMYEQYPLSPIHIILLAFLNDIPIISLAFNRVKLAQYPSKINIKKRFILSSLLGLVGVITSILFFIIAKNILKLPDDVISTLFFLKLTVSGHLLLYVAHTECLWFKFLPSKEVIFSTLGTQLLATSFASFGIFIAKAPWEMIVFVWIWAILWMQVSELAKQLLQKSRFYKS